MINFPLGLAVLKSKIFVVSKRRVPSLVLSKWMVGSKSPKTFLESLRIGVLVSGGEGDVLVFVGVSNIALPFLGCGDSDPADNRAPKTWCKSERPSSVGCVRISAGIRIHHSPRQVSRLSRSRFSSSVMFDVRLDRFLLVRLAKVLKQNASGSDQGEPWLNIVLFLWGVWRNLISKSIPSQNFDDFLGNFRIVVEEVPNVIGQQEKHVRGYLSHGFVVES